MRWTSLAIIAALAGPAAAQTAIPDRDGWTSSLTGRTFNNPMSAVIDGQILRSRQQAAAFSNALMQQMFSDHWRGIGREIVAAKRATTALNPLDAAMARRAAELSLGVAAPDDRVEAIATQLAADFAVVGKVAADRGVALDDASRLLALAMAVGYERYRGKPLAPPQIEGLAAAFRQSLMTDLVYQGQRQIAAELMAAKFSSAIADVERINATGDADATRAAGGALLQSLWTDPVDAIIPTRDGLDDRGRWIVRQRAGTTTFRRPIADERLAREASQSLHFSGGLATSKEEADRAADAERAKWVADRCADVEAMRGEIAKVDGSPDDLAACAAAVVARLWPLVDPDAKPVGATQRTQASRMFADDIRNDPTFQRLGDAGRQRVFEQWATRAKAAERMIAATSRVAALEAKATAAADAMETLVLRSQAGVARSEAASGRAKAIALLAELFAPRDLAKVELTDDGFVVRE